METLLVLCRARAGSRRFALSCWISYAFRGKCALECYQIHKCALECYQIYQYSPSHALLTLTLCHSLSPQTFKFSDGSDPQGATTARAWSQMYPDEPYYPPSPPSSKTASYITTFTAEIAAVAVRQPLMTHQLLRAAFVQRQYLNRAKER